MTNNRQFPPVQAHGWSCDQVREELEAWAIGALEPLEMAQIEQHISECDGCRLEADSLVKVASALPYALEPVAPSADVKRALMNRIADDQMAMAQTPATLPSGTRPGLHHSGAPDEKRHFNRTTWSQALLPPLAIALVVMTLWSVRLNDRVAELSDGDTETTSMLPSGVQTFSMSAGCEGCDASGKLLANPATSDALFVGWDLEASQENEMWCIEEDGKKLLVATLDVSPDGDVVQPLVFDQPIATYSQIYVTRRSDGADNEMMLEITGDQFGSPGTTPTVFES